MLEYRLSPIIEQCAYVALQLKRCSSNQLISILTFLLQLLLTPYGCFRYSNRNHILVVYYCMYFIHCLYALHKHKLQYDIKKDILYHYVFVPIDRIIICMYI